MSNFWRFLDLPLVTCKIELDFLWSKEFIISKITIAPTVPGNSDDNSPVLAVIQTTGFHINNTKLYVPVATLPIIDNIKFLEKIRPRFERIISWKKYRSEMTTQTKAII